MTSTESTRSLIYNNQNVSTKRQVSRLYRIRQVWGIIFLSPWLIGFIGLTLFPMAASLVLSFTDYNLNRADQINWIGLQNYHKMLFIDPLVGTSLAATFRFALIALPLSIILPVALAALLNAKQLMAKRLFRTLFYMPYMVPVVSAVYIWQGMLNSEAGWINRALEGIGITGPQWLNDVTWIYPALNIIGLWGIGNAFLITLASMQGVPTELYEASTVDGAGPWRRFRHITLPMISPVIFYNLVLSVIGLFRYFEIPYILSQGTGRPGSSTMFFNIHLYKTAFVFKDMGYGSALAWLLFFLAFIATIALFLSARYWVYYAHSEDNI
jgi:multiple sugar transport system permease protein